MASSLIVQPREYVSGFVPTDYNFLAQQAQYHQQRYDQARAMKAQSLADLKSTLYVNEKDKAYRDKLIAELETKFGDISGRYNNDLSAAGNDIVDAISAARGDSFWIANKKALEEKAKEDELRARYGSKALAFKTVQGAVDDQGNVRNISDIGAEIQEEMDYVGTAEALWNRIPNTSWYGGWKDVVKTGPDGKQYVVGRERAKYTGLQKDIIDKRLDEMFEAYKQDENATYSQQYRKLREIGGFVKTADGKEEFRPLSHDEAEAQIKDMIRESGVRRYNKPQEDRESDSYSEWEFNFANGMGDDNTQSSAQLLPIPSTTNPGSIGYAHIKTPAMEAAAKAMGIPALAPGTTTETLLKDARVFDNNGYVRVRDDKGNPIPENAALSRTIYDLRKEHNIPNNVPAQLVFQQYVLGRNATPQRTYQITEDVGYFGSLDDIDVAAQNADYYVTSNVNGVTKRIKMDASQYAAYLKTQQTRVNANGTASAVKLDNIEFRNWGFESINGQVVPVFKTILPNGSYVSRTMDDKTARLLKPIGKAAQFIEGNDGKGAGYYMEIDGLEYTNPATKETNTVVGYFNFKTGKREFAVVSSDWLRGEELNGVSAIDIAKTLSNSTQDRSFGIETLEDLTMRNAEKLGLYQLRGKPTN